MGNPYSITPAGNYGRELMGLGGLIGELGESKRKRTAEDKESAKEAYAESIFRAIQDHTEWAQCWNNAKHTTDLWVYLKVILISKRLHRNP